MIRTLIIGDEVIAYDFTRKAIKNVNLRIRADGSVTVSAPYGVSEAFIGAFLREKSDFILRAKLKQASRPAEVLPEPYKDGGSYVLFGDTFVIAVDYGASGEVRVENGRLYVPVSGGGDDLIRTIEVFERDVLCETVERYLQKWYPRFAAYTNGYPTIRYRRMKKQWGNCRPKQNIVTFNTALVHKPLSLIEYVVCHEFCHFIHADHSAAFYASLAACLPDHRERQRALKK